MYVTSILFLLYVVVHCITSLISLTSQSDQLITGGRFGHTNSLQPHVYRFYWVFTTGVFTGYCWVFIVGEAPWIWGK